jgi:L-lactate dehydrogenase complex protein LldE
MANSGFEHLTGECTALFTKNFKDFDYIVSPSGSCVLHIKEHAHEKAGLHDRIFEFVEFLTDILKVDHLDASFPYRVGLHQSCHGQRGLHLAQMSELMAPPFSKPVQLLNMVKKIQLIELDRKDECCGFGGTFCVTEEAISVKMGKDRVVDHVKHGAEVITGSDMSCLMHLEGILRRQQSPVRVQHIAEILNSNIGA